MNKHDVKNRCKGSLIGLALGDVLGLPFEFWKKESVEKHFESHELVVSAFVRGDQIFPVGFYSDDTAMTICLTESLTKKGFDLDDQFSKYRSWYLHGYRTPNEDECYGIGQQTMRSLQKKPDFNKLDGSDERAGGNGSLMRCAPIGLRYQGSLSQIKEKSLLSGYLTHNNMIAGWACVILNSVISLIIDGLDKKDILPQLHSHYQKDAPDEILELLQLPYEELNVFPYTVSGYSLDTLRIALWSWMTSESYMESIKKVILLGNDTDTFAAVTGAITGCYWGYDSIPDEYKLRVVKHDYMLSLAGSIYKLRCQKMYLRFSYA